MTAMDGLVEEADRAFELSRRSGATAWSLPDVALLEVTSDGCILTAAGKVEWVVGRPVGELQGASFQSLLPHEQRSRLVAALAAVATGSTGALTLTVLRLGQPVECEVFCWSADAAPGEGQLRALLRRR